MDRVNGPLGSVSLVQEGAQKSTRLSLVAHAFNPDTQEKGLEVSVSSRTTRTASGAPGLHAETLSENIDQVTQM